MFIFDLSNSPKRGSILWGDEIFGRHAPLSRGWGEQDKRSIEPFRCKA